MTVDKKAIAELISRRRRQLLVHRFLYYIYSKSLITDATYDKWERELAELVRKYGKTAKTCIYNDICPIKTVGSSDRDSYPINIISTAERLLRYNEEDNKKKQVQKKKLLPKRKLKKKK
jgi:hypothetical protein